MKILQINAVANSGSTGRIAEEIGNVLLAHGHESYIAYGRGNATSASKLIKIGSQMDVYLHGAYTLLTDKHGFASKKATENFIKEVEKIKPDLIALHNLHGYYIHLPTLFAYINMHKIPVVWTLFDCWAFTGHCTYFDDINCKKWESHCEKCPKHKRYPSSWVDNSFDNFEAKQDLFTSVKKMELITHSQWLGDLVKKSFLKNYTVHVTPSAINLDLFKPLQSKLRDCYELGDKKVVLGCASTWSNRKGYMDFVELSKKLSNDYQIVMIGLNTKELNALPDNIIGLERTESVQELAQWYSLAHIFVNPTSQDNFPTTNLEALACGTPVITYNTGGSPEAIDKETGLVVEKGSISGILKAIEELEKRDYEQLSEACRARAELLFDKKIRYLDYLNIFQEMLNKKHVKN
ncbi:glycosyltransferase [Cecembia lonarensis]|uniref:Putative glycosyl transferase n=1 Tax=Cecembia lonarensis (strain CCUG 58316 / KCTC 22772 / LW9) TaxID=1225176 RepID=K1LA51_CECL9|nr:glycosyltransferase [Cecembia lonarensis]EKB49137.1 putative glycosyl transferase [Cecembia lonarensis LW9]